MKSAKMQNRRNSTVRRTLALAESLTTGTKVTAPNEDPVRLDLIELEPFVKVKKPSRSSTIYERVE